MYGFCHSSLQCMHHHQQWWVQTCQSWCDLPIEQHGTYGGKWGSRRPTEDNQWLPPLRQCQCQMRTQECSSIHPLSAKTHQGHTWQNLLDAPTKACLWQHAFWSQQACHTGGKYGRSFACMWIGHFDEHCRGGVPNFDTYCVLSEYPQGTVKKNFSKLTLCSHKEKVGILYYLLLGLHDKSGRAIFEIAKQRRQQNYKTFPTKKKIKECQDVANTGKVSKKGRNWWQF